MPSASSEAPWLEEWGRHRPVLARLAAQQGRHGFKHFGDTIYGEAVLRVRRSACAQPQRHSGA